MVGQWTFPSEREPPRATQNPVNWINQLGEPIRTRRSNFPSGKKMLRTQTPTDGSRLVQSQRKERRQLGAGGPISDGGRENTDSAWLVTLTALRASRALRVAEIPRVYTTTWSPWLKYTTHPVVAMMVMKLGLFKATSAKKLMKREAKLKKFVNLSRSFTAETDELSYQEMK